MYYPKSDTRFIVVPNHLQSVLQYTVVVPNKLQSTTTYSLFCSTLSSYLVNCSPKTTCNVLQYIIVVPPIN